MVDWAFDGEEPAGVGAAWERFIDVTEPLRPELFRFALKLTGNAFDAEDLVHDALLRAFGSMAVHYGRVSNMRAYLYRICSNLWIDETRRAWRFTSLEATTLDHQHPASPAAETATDMRDAADTIFAVLAPRERAAVVLKEACDFSHAEIADLLATTEGAVKTALHRAKRRLKKVANATVPRPRASRALVDRFVDAMRAHDLEALKALLVDSLEAETFPSGVGVGIDHHEKNGWLFGCFYHHISWREAAKAPYPLHLEIRDIAGDPAVLVSRDNGDGPALEEVWRFEEADGRIARIKDYCFCPDLVRHVAEQVGLPSRAVGYRFRPGLFSDSNKSGAKP